MDKGLSHLYAGFQTRKENVLDTLGILSKRQHIPSCGLFGNPSRCLLHVSREADQNLTFEQTGPDLHRLLPTLHISVYYISHEDIEAERNNDKNNNKIPFWSITGAK